MTAAARRLAALGTLDVDELRRELAELDRARAALRGLIIALETHDEDEPPGLPGLDGILEAAARIGINVETDDALPPNVVVIRRSAREVSLAEAAELVEEAEQRHVHDDTDALARDLADGARLTIVETTGALELRRAEEPGNVDDDDDPVGELEAGGTPPLEDVRQVDEDAPAWPARSAPAEAPAPESSPTAPAPAPGIAERAELVAAVLEANRGEWMTSGNIARAVDGNLSADGLRYALRRLLDAGRIEHNGRARGGRRYRAPHRQDEATPADPTPDPANAPEEAPTEPTAPVRGQAGPADDACPLCGFTDCPGHGSHAAARPRPEPPAPPARVTVPGRPRALLGAPPRDDDEERPGVPKSGRLLRQERAEERERNRIRIAGETGDHGARVQPRPSPDGEPTLEGRLLSELAYRPGTLRELAGRLGITTGSDLEAVARALSRLADEGDVERITRDNGNGRHVTYRAAGVLSPVG